MLLKQKNYIYIVMFVLVAPITCFCTGDSFAQNHENTATEQLQALFESLKDSDITEINRLIKEGADVNVRNKWGGTPLYTASNGHTEIVTLLLATKADVNAANINGVTPLFIASMNGHTEIVKLLIESKANVNAANKTGNVTPLILASQNGHTETVKLLLAAEADINIVTENGVTPMSTASQNDHAEIVELLKKQNITENDKKPPEKTSIK